MKSILLTGTIKPKNIIHTTLLDYKLREIQYLNTIDFFLNNTKFPIIFAENSNYSDNLKNHFKRQIECGRLEILSYYGLNFSENLGKGYGEMDIIEYTLENSKLIKLSSHIFKVTGRYQILNFGRLSKYAIEANLDLFVQFKRNLTFCDSRFFFSNINFLSNYLIKYKSLINDSEGIYFEHILAKASHEAVKDGLKFSFLNTYPVFKGIYATKNTKYTTNWFYTAPRKILYFITFNLIRR